MIAEIDNALTFSDLLKITERLDFANSDDPSVQKLGSNGMNKALYLASFVSNEASFAYYASYFRSKAIEEMEKYGYKDAQNPITETIRNIK